MSSVFTRAFWRETAERVISSSAQGALVGWGAGAFTVVGEVVPAAQAAGLGALGMGVATLLKCLVASKVGEPGTPSLLPAQDPVGDHEAPAEPVD